MAKISCTATTCSHNKSGECYANCIQIVGNSAQKDGDTACGSFLNRLHYSELTNNTYSEGSCDCLTCVVESCKYNENRLCSRGDILVQGDTAEYYSDTECHSFEVKCK